ncbi:MAG TPA: hypothetical protein VH331_10290 [Allosphingosinicella sp.]|jgi:hypothetical protein|nr:hypothetical protein [Allosphingosinicella sp.]
MRPKSIVNFEIAALLAVLVSIVNSFASWDKMMAVQQAQLVAKGQEKMLGMMSSIGIGFAVIIVAIWLLLIWLVSRKGSPAAKWIYAVLAVIFLLFGLYGLTKGPVYGTVQFVLAIVWDLLSLASLWFLFRPESAAWFAEGRTADPADL